MSSRLWPYGTRAGLLSVPIILVGLLAVMSVARNLTGWPSNESEKTILLGIFVLAVTPLGLAVIDARAERGAVLEYAGAKIDLSRMPGPSLPTASVPVNIGVPGEPVSDSSTSRILDALREAVSTDVVVIDLENGQAWWETRLLVLLAGGVRLHRPEVVVFVATDR